MDNKLQIPQRKNTQLADPHRQAASNLRYQKALEATERNRPYRNPDTQQTQKSQPQVFTHDVKINPIAKNVAQNHTLKEKIQPASSGEQWQKYHAAWQNYYQKYYESYYSKALEHHKKTVANIQPEVVEQLSESDKKNRALAQLKKDISQKAREKTEKIRKSRHFVPIFSAILVVLIFAFLQYNRFIFASVEAYIAPANVNPQDTIQTPNATVSVGQDPRIIIPKINVEAPVIYGVSSDGKAQLNAMNNGVVHFSIPGANSVPGQVGNTILSGHSSNDIFDSGNYKFIFAQLEKLEKEDVIYVNYQGTRYSYSVKEKKVVLPSDVSSVILDTDKPMLTLITCTPIGTAEKRLLVIAEQISPDPAEAKPKSEEDSKDSKKQIELPRNSLTFFERLFTWNWK